MEKNVQAVITMLTLGKMVMGPSYTFAQIAEIHNKTMGEDKLHGVDVLTVAHTLDITSEAATAAMSNILDCAVDSACEMIDELKNSMMMNN